MPSKKLSLYFILFSVMALGSLLEFRIPRIRSTTLVVERIPAREAQKMGVSYRN